MYFDAVLNDETMSPVYNGTPDETKEWLEKYARLFLAPLNVCVGRTLDIVTVPEYLAGDYR
jgi:deoxycytidine triphosphate deaminase